MGILVGLALLYMGILAPGLLIVGALLVLVRTIGNGFKDWWKSIRPVIYVMVVVALSMLLFNHFLGAWLKNNL